MKKFLPILLTLILALALCMSITAFATDGECTHTDGNDDYNNVCDDCKAYIGYSELVLGENSVMMGDYYGDQNLIKFVPQEDGFYEFFSTMSTNDPRAYLYDSNLKRLEYNDDDGESYNFKFAYELVAGETYYLAAVTTRDIEHCPITVAKHETHIDYEDSVFNVCDLCYEYLLDYDAELGTNTLELVSWDYAGIRFVPEESGVFKIYSSVDFTVTVEVWDDELENRVVDYVDKISESGLECYVELTAGESYYMAFYTTQSTDGNEVFSFDVETHEHTGGILTCLGMLCDCGFYYGDQMGDHRLGIQTCEGYECSDCGEFFGEKNDNHVDVSSMQTCMGYHCWGCYEYVGEKADHNLSTEQYCAGYECSFCGKFFGEGTGLHEDSNDSNDNMCDVCNLYVGTIEIVMGENTVPLTEGKYTYVEFVPSESATYEITIVTESSHNVNVYDADLNSLTRDFNGDSYYFILEADKTYYFAFRDFFGTNTEMLINVKIHEHSGGTQSCKGYWCACGVYYGEKDLTNHGWNNGTCWRCDAVCEHTTEPRFQDCRGYYCECGVYYGEKDLTKHDWDYGTCWKCDVACEHTTEPIGQDCRGYVCECGIGYGEKLDHVDGSDHTNNLCDFCSVYLGTVDVELGENWVDITSNKPTFLKFVPEESGDYYIYSISEIDPKITVYDSDFNYIDEADDEDGHNFKIVVYLTAGEIYYFSFYSFSSTTGYDYVIEKHEHSYVLTCIGNLCVCGDVDSSEIGDHIPAGAATCTGILCSVCEESYGEPDPDVHNWDDGECVDCYTECEHETTPIKHVCTGYLCECDVIYGEGGGDHYDGKDYYVNLCDYCYNGYLGTVDVVLGENTVSREEYQVIYVRFIPSESGVYRFYSTGTYDPEITIYDEHFDEIINMDDNNGHNFDLYIELTANETYYLSLLDHGYATEFTFSIESHEHSGGEQYCKGYLCECGYYYGEKGEHIDVNNYIDNICDVCSEYLGTTDAVMGSNTISYNNEHFTAIRFIPAESGIYKIYSKGNTDPIIDIYNSFLQEIQHADDTIGYGFNFVVYVQLEAEEIYYLSCFDYELLDGNEIVIEKHEHSFDDQICVGGLCECGNIDFDSEGNPDNHYWLDGECIYHTDIKLPEGFVHDHLWANGKCCICEDKHKHQIENVDADRRICTVCYAFLSLKVEGDGKLAYFSSLDEALEYAENGDTVQMIRSLYFDESITITKNIIFDLNGYEVYDYSSYNIYVDADVRFIDSSSEKTGYAYVDLFIGSSGAVVESGYFESIHYLVDDGKSIADILGSCIRVYDGVTNDLLDLTNTDVLEGYYYLAYDHNEIDICTGTICLECGERTYGAGDPNTHNFDNYEIVENATCTSNAIEKGTCTWCEEATDTREIENTKKPHRFTPVYGDGYKVCICGARVENKMYSGDTARAISAAATRAAVSITYEFLSKTAEVVADECIYYFSEALDYFKSLIR